MFSNIDILFPVDLVELELKAERQRRRINVAWISIKVNDDLVEARLVSDEMED
jgi:hypothetical protein